MRGLSSKLFINRLGAALTVLRTREINSSVLGESRQVAEVLVRKVPDNQQVSFCLYIYAFQFRC